MSRVKIICTLGPKSYDKKTLLLLKKENIDIFRINLSHTKENKIEKIISYLKKISIKNKIYIGFNNLCLEVKKKNKSKNFILCKVLSSGYLESNKGVHIDADLNLDPLTNKDKKALEIAKKLKIKNFAVSFVNHQNDLDKVRKLVGNKVNIISKIETINAIKNLRQISKKSDALLIDRGDLSRYIPVETIPSAQEYIVKITKKMKKVIIYVFLKLISLR